MQWEIKSFNHLTTQELYDLIQLRVDVFVVEQECPYHELDGKDQKAYHLLGRKNQELVAYSRLFLHDDLHGEASIGRVIVRNNARDKGYGKELMRRGIAFLEEKGGGTIKIMAQEYLERFYQSFDFIRISDSYDEDGIPHIDMIRIQIT